MTGNSIARQIPICRIGKNFFEIGVEKSERMWYNIGEKELEFQPAGKDGRDDCNIQSMPVYLPPDKAWSPFPGLLWAFLGDSGASGQRAEKGACGKGRHGSGEGGTSGKNRPAPQKKSCKKTHRLFWKVLIGFTYQYEKWNLAHRQNVSFRTSAHTGVGISIEFQIAFRHTP